MRIVTISSLYPNNEDPKHGIFVENRLRQLLTHHPQIHATVIAPVPWFPVKSARFAEYAKFVDVKSQEQRHGIDIVHPRYVVIPKVGMLLTPFFMAWSVFWALRKNIQQYGKPDLIDGHYFFPDGVAIALVAKVLKIPFTCTSRGTDINLIADMPRPKRLIQWVIKRAAKCMAVCQALTDKLAELGADKPVNLRNGVDLDFFTPLSAEQRSTARQTLLQSHNIARQDTSKVLLSVGWLVERKGHYLVIEAMRKLSDYHLFIAGNGPDHQALQAQIRQHGLDERVTLVGALSQTQLREYYQVADALVLASSREGWANVLLESMACGTPVVATNIWGTPEVVQSAQAGVLCERSASHIAEGVQQLFSDYPNRNDTRAYAQQFDWQSTSDGQLAIFNEIIQRQGTV